LYLPEFTGMVKLYQFFYRARAPVFLTAVIFHNHQTIIKIKN
jgi:hypothetical protein